MQSRQALPRRRARRPNMGKRVEWAPAVVDAAKDADLGLDANGYLAPWSLIRYSVAAV